MHFQAIFDTTFALVSKTGDVRAVLDMDPDLCTAHIHRGSVPAVLRKLAGYLEQSKWSHWKIQVDASVVWSHPIPSEQILPYAWAFYDPSQRLIALVHQDPADSSRANSLCFPERLLQCALNTHPDPDPDPDPDADATRTRLAWQPTRVHIEAVEDPANRPEKQTVRISFHPPVAAWASHMQDDVQVCIKDWLETHGPAVTVMRHFSPIVYSYSREPMYIRQYYTPDVFHQDRQAFFLRTLYVHLDPSYQHVIPPLFLNDWWRFRNTLQGILVSAHHAARVVQRVWRECIANPYYTLCRKRLCRECQSEKIEAFKE